MNGTTERMMPVRPAQRNWKRNAQANSIGVAKRRRPPYIVATQLNKLAEEIGTRVRALATGSSPTS